MESYSKIIKTHPGLVLTSENPMTWRGFLIVDPNLGFTVDIKLIVPNYPRLLDAELLFGQSISLLFGMEFDNKIIRLLENATTVSSLLLQLKRIVSNIIKDKFGSRDRSIASLQEGIVEELDAALRINSPVVISASGTLNIVKLTLSQVELTLRKDSSSNTWKVLSSDLPEVDWLEPFELNLRNLGDALIKLQNRASMLEDAWNQLEEIDGSCWVIDPPDPKRYHLYRRIKLTPSLSALMTIDPVHAMERPDIKLLGSDRDVAKYRNIMNSQLLSWDPECSIAENLRILFAIDELPQPPEVGEIREKNALVEDDECFICYSRELDNQSPAQLPVEICDNEKCRRHFHTFCLVQWLQSAAVNQVSFNRIHGTCINCGESISCSVITS